MDGPPTEHRPINLRGEVAELAVAVASLGILILNVRLMSGHASNAALAAIYAVRDSSNALSPKAADTLDIALADISNSRAMSDQIQTEFNNIFADIKAMLERLADPHA